MSTNWITPSADDLNDYLAGAYATATRTAALATGQTDTFARVSSGVITEIRSHVRSAVRNQVSQTEGTIPPDLKDAAMALIVERMQSRLASVGIKLGEEPIHRAADIARAYLKSVAEGKVVITKPTDPLIPDDQQRGSAIAVVRHNARRYSRQQTRGL